MKTFGLRTVAGLLFAALSLSVFGATEEPPGPEDRLPGEVQLTREQITDADCLGCHGQKGFGTRSAVDGSWRNLDVDADALHQSVHGDYSCLYCHADIEQLPHKVDLQEVDCVTCHIEQGEGAAPERTPWLQSDSTGAHPMAAE